MRDDPVTLRLVMLSLTCAVPLAVAAARERCNIDTNSRLAALPSAPGQQKSATGCIDANSANAVDWQQVPGVSRKVAQALAEHCQSTLTCARDRPPMGVKGVGPVISAKIAEAICGAAAVEPVIPAATPARKHRAALAPLWPSDSPQ